LIKQIKRVYDVLELREINADTYMLRNLVFIVSLYDYHRCRKRSVISRANNSGYGSTIIAGVT